jgi:hypothetical protein
MVGLGMVLSVLTTTIVGIWWLGQCPCCRILNGAFFQMVDFDMFHKNFVPIIQVLHYKNEKISGKFLVGEQGTWICCRHFWTRGWTIACNQVLLDQHVSFTFLVPIFGIMFDKKLATWCMNRVCPSSSTAAVIPKLN